MCVWCCRTDDGASVGCVCARPRVLVLVILRVVDLAVLALTRKIIIIVLFDSSIWCGKHSAALLHANKYVFGFLPSSIPSIGSLYLKGPALCPAFDSHLGVFWQTLEAGEYYAAGWGSVYSADHQKLKMA